MLRDLSYKGVYKSDFDNILEDFYFPTLSVANRYDRAVGFFSASTISYAAQALSVFVKNGGQIRLILGAFSDREDLEAVKQGYREKEISEKIGSELLSMVSHVSDELFQNRFETLSWLVAHGRLEVKIALRERGMYHDKVGVISDEAKDRVVFAGSANESTHALLPTHNYESINVFKSWMPEHQEFFDPHVESFDRLWKNESPSTAVLDIPTAVRDKLISVSRSLDYTPDPEIEAEIAARIQARTGTAVSTVSNKPREPATINGQPFKMRDHQIAALEAWKAKGDFQGTFDLATGAGKTITAIHAIVKLSEVIDGLICVIAAPYQNLADQWVDILSTFNIYPVKCYVSRANWEEKLRNTVHELTMGSRSFAAIVVVNRTLKSPEFQECLNKIKGNRLLWIGDECHHHTSKAYEGFLPIHARYRIGLSATPEHYLDEERNERLNEFYGDIVYSYTLKQAITDKVLTPYVYYPHLVELTQDEAEEFVELSEQIGRIMARKSAQKASEMSPQLTGLLMRRARLIGSAANKIPMLQAVLTGDKPTQHTLFYCGDGTVETDETEESSEESIRQSKRQVEAVSAMLHSMGWDVSRFTSRESRKDRDNIMENFRLGMIDAMVAIRCLDEGIDVPACSTAYILASSRDPRQFVQRRGRILRRSPGKEQALIHDFVVVLPSDFETDSHYAKRLIKSELGRVAEFSSLSENRSDAYETLAPVLRAYDLEHLI
ncbi:DEAD/DEAH box helicase family protein [Ruegeria sp. HKCCA5929]|uniref:DEAD/DEAH box helicase family protein n=1 Tax=Ruegeria sp. HKCCA5929 TaxID=2682988 RepID=UPI001489A18C|nr:DEAD/DEAH box helicase family protein [Ruegeria sp. HKCCA5929]